MTSVGWMLFLPFFVIHVEVLPPTRIAEGEDVLAFSKRVQRTVADALGIGTSSLSNQDKSLFMQAVGIHEIDPRLWKKFGKDVKEERADILRRQTETTSPFAHPNKKFVLAQLKKSENTLREAVVRERRASSHTRLHT